MDMAKIMRPQYSIPLPSTWIRILHWKPYISRLIEGYMCYLSILVFLRDWDTDGGDVADEGRDESSSP